MATSYYGACHFRYNLALNAKKPLLSHFPPLQKYFTYTVKMKKNIYASYEMTYHLYGYSYEQCEITYSKMCYFTSPLYVLYHILYLSICIVHITE